MGFHVYLYVSFLNFTTMIIQSIKKAENFGSDNAFVSVRFAKRTSGSKFAIGCLNDGESYSATYDLQRIYPEFYDKEDKKFKAKKALEQFESEMIIGQDEDINGYEFSIASLTDGKIEKVKIAGTDKEMIVMRPACYGDEAHAKQLCLNSLRRQLADKTLIPIVDKKDDDNDDDEDDDE
jgi:hypothetical protein